MADDTAFTGEVRAFAFGFVPPNWHRCDGTLLPIEPYRALYTVLGNAFGGNNTTTFALPDLRGRVPVGAGATYARGQVFGVEQHRMDTPSALPPHRHDMMAAQAAGTVLSPKDARLADVIGNDPEADRFLRTGTPDTMLQQAALAPSGEDNPKAFSNMQPYETISYCICASGADVYTA